MNDGRKGPGLNSGWTIKTAAVCPNCSHTSRRHGPDGCAGLTELGGPECHCRQMPGKRERQKAFVNNAVDTAEA
jgi:hypothetical protein